MAFEKKKLIARNLFCQVIYHRVFHLFTKDTEALVVASLSLSQFLALMGNGIFYSQAASSPNDPGTSILRIIFFIFTMMKPINASDSEILIHNVVGIILCGIVAAFHLTVLAYLLFGGTKNKIDNRVVSFLAYYSFYYPNLIHFMLQNIGLELIYDDKVSNAVKIVIIVFCVVGVIEAFLMLIFTNDTIFVRNQLARKKLAVNYVEFFLKVFLSVFTIFLSHDMDHTAFRIVLNLTILFMTLVCLSQPTFYYLRMFTLSLTMRLLTQMAVLFPLIFTDILDYELNYLTWPYLIMTLALILKYSINARKGTLYPFFDHLWNPSTENDAFNCYFTAYEVFSRSNFLYKTNQNISERELYARGLLANIGESLLNDVHIHENDKYILRRSMKKNELIELKDLVLENLLRRYYHKFKSDLLGFNLLTKMILNESQVNYSQIVMILHRLRKSKWTIYQKALIDMLVKMLKESKNENSLLDVDYIINFERKYNKLLARVTEEGKLHISFWETSQKQIISAEKIFNLSQEIDQLNSKVEYIWSKIDKNDVYKGSHFYFVYGYYQTIIRNDTEKGRQLVKRINQINNQAIKNSADLISANVLTESNAVITISGDQRNIGEILFCSDGVRNLFGYDSDYLLHKNVNVLVPHNLAVNHHSYIQRYLDTNESRIIDQVRPVFSVDNEGTLVPCQLTIKFYPFSHLGLTFTAVMRRIDHYGDAIIFHKDGSCEGCTKGVLNKLSLDQKTIKSASIFDFMSGLDESIEEEIRLNFPYEYPKMKVIPDYTCLDMLEELVKKHPEETIRVFKDNLLKVSSRRILGDLKPNELVKRTLSERSQDMMVTYLDCSIEFEQFGEFTMFILKLKVIHGKQMVTVGSTKFTADLDTTQVEMQKETSFIMPSVAEMRGTPNYEPSITDFKQTTRRDGNSSRYDLKSRRNHSIRIKQIQADSFQDDKSYTDANSMEFRFSGNDESARASKEKQALIEEPSVASSKKSSDTKFFKSFRLAIEESYKPYSIKILQISLIFFILLSTLFFVLIGIFSNDKVAQLKTTSYMIHIGEKRQEMLVEFSRNMRISKLILDGTFERNRLISINITDYLSYLLTEISSHSEQIIEYNDELRRMLHTLPQKYIDLFYEKNIELDYSALIDSTSGLSLYQIKNGFDAIEEIAWSGHPIHKRIATLQSDDKQISFILTNSLNDAYTQSSKNIDHLLMYIRDYLDNYQLLIVIFMGLVIGLGILILGGSIFYNTIIYHKIVNHFLEAFTRMNMKDAEFTCDKIKSITAHLSRVKKNEIGKWSRSDIEKIKHKTGSSAKKNDKKRTFTVGAILVRPLKDALFLFSTVIVSTVMIVLVFKQGDSFQKNFIKIANRAIFAIEDLSNLGITMAGTYEFIQEDMSTSLKSQPISDILEKMISTVGNIQDGFNRYSNDGVNIDSRYSPYVQGDLCHNSATSAASCLLDEQVSTDGILGIKTYFSSSLKNLRDQYLRSNRTVEAKKLIFDEQTLLSIERISLITARPAYENLEKLLQNDIKTYLSDYEGQILILIVVAAFLSLIFPLIVMNFVMKKLMSQYDRIKVILKPVPIQMVVDNKSMVSIVKKLSPNTHIF